MDILLSSTEAARYLGVSRQTLYAYVSRGWVRSEAGGSSRSRRYNRLDLERLRQRKEVRSEPARKLTTALSWGVPLLETELTLIDEGQLYYRGRNAVELARSERFFSVIKWFWNQDPFQVLTDGTAFVNPRLNSSPLREFQRCLMELSDRDVGGYDLSVPTALSTGWRILELFLQCLVGRSDVRLEDATEQLQQAWAPKSPDLTGLLNAALILCMDHELNASSFTARVVASAESSLYEIVLAGLCALRGHRHGGMSLLCYQLLTELESTNTLRTTLVEWHREKGFVPGFGHPLYPAGDVRAKALLLMLRKTRVGQSQAKLVAQAVQVLRKPATIDLVLAALARAYGLPASSPFSIFALARIAGWIGHAIEQHRQGGLIRPRARYIGRMPG
ncbi:MAG: citrate synthase family protein [Verrucomicrobia bacterium]|nr:citrate synthase family protein [Verrucomicrobiota bacterium]MBV8483621.1 citrate synthase family protein [Verrucomicrobiota bacterium]